MKIENAERDEFTPIELKIRLDSPMDVAWLLLLFGNIPAHDLDPRSSVSDEPVLRYINERGYTASQLVAHINSINHVAYGELKKAVRFGGRSCVDASDT